MAATLKALRDAADHALESRGENLEIVQPQAWPSWLYLWTPPSEEGWTRTLIGGLYLEVPVQFAEAPRPDMHG